MINYLMALDHHESFCPLNTLSHDLQLKSSVWILVCFLKSDFLKNIAISKEWIIFCCWPQIEWNHSC